MTRSEVLKELHIGIQALTQYTNTLYPEGKKEKGYNEIDVEKIRKMLYNDREEKQEEKKVSLGFEKCSENEFYAKIVKEDKTFSAGVFSSTNLSEDIVKFNRRGMKLAVIDETEYGKLLVELSKGVSL